MQILVHVSILESIVSRFLSGVGGCVEMLKLRRKSHADFERVSHDIGSGYEGNR